MWGQYSGWQFSWGAIFCRGNFLGENFYKGSNFFIRRAIFWGAICQGEFSGSIFPVGGGGGGVCFS